MVDAGQLMQDSTTYTRQYIKVMGSAVGIASAAAVSIVVGGLIGTVMGYIVSVPAAIRDKVAQKA